MYHEMLRSNTIGIKANLLFSTEPCSHRLNGGIWGLPLQSMKPSSWQRWRRLLVSMLLGNYCFCKYLITWLCVIYSYLVYSIERDITTCYSNTIRLLSWRQVFQLMGGNCEWFKATRFMVPGVCCSRMVPYLKGSALLWSPNRVDNIRPIV